jgi:hypothetical protein
MKKRHYALCGLALSAALASVACQRGDQNSGIAGKDASKNMPGSTASNQPGVMARPSTNPGLTQDQSATQSANSANSPHSGNSDISSGATNDTGSASGVSR